VRPARAVGSGNREACCSHEEVHHFSILAVRGAIVLPAGCSRDEGRQAAERLAVYTRCGWSHTTNLSRRDFVRGIGRLTLAGALLGLVLDVGLESAHRGRADLRNTGLRRFTNLRAREGPPVLHRKAVSTVNARGDLPEAGDMCWIELGS